MHRGLLHKLLLSLVGFFAGIPFLWAQPANDLCTAAQVLTVQVGTCTSPFYTNVAATTTGNPATPACWNPATMSNTVWFSFIATAADVEISTNFGGTLADTQIAVYSGTCGALNLLACQEDVNTIRGLLNNDVILHGLTLGNTYYIAIDGNGNQTGDFGVCIQQVAPVGPPLPIQDCIGSQSLCNLNQISVPDGPGSIGPNPEWPSCFGSPGERSSNWYSFTAATSGTFCFTINPTTDIDYDFAVYNSASGCPGTEIVCNWDPDSPVTGLGCTGFQCEPCISVVAGQTYTILIDRFTAASTSGFTMDFTGTTATVTSPNPTFTANTVCLGTPTQFTNTTPGNFTYNWNFGDGFTSTLENPTHTYATTGPHTVTLLVTAVPGGCQNSITQTVNVNPMPTASAGSGTTQCPGACYNLSGSTNAIGYLGTTTFSNNGSYAIPDNNTTGVFSPITVSGVNPTTVTASTIASVCIDITHTFDGDLDIFLQAPNGTQIDLSSDNGGAGDNYTGTCFSTSALTAITGSTSPFTGSFLPEQAFTGLNGSNVNGTWQLFVRDDAGGDVGTINNWSITLSNMMPGFSWSPTTAMTNANTLTPTVCPTTTTTYTLTATNGPGCTTTSSVTINVSGGSTANISYPSTTVCTTAGTQAVTLTGTGTYTGGTFTAGAGLSINSSSGLITPGSSTPGPYTVTYTIPASGGCPAVTATTNITIVAPPNAGTLSGTQNICIGDSVTFASTVLGGSWTSSNPAVATINSSTGAIVGVAAGTSTMTYTVLGSGGCANATATRVVTVTAPVSAGTLSGTQNICIGDSVTFASTVLGGSWTSSNPAVATINSSTGAIVGVTAGSSTMTYTVLGSGGCPNATATRTVTVTAPVVAGTLSGTQNICIGDSVTFTSTVLGGTWTSSNPAVATINAATGAIVGVAAGSSTMTYTVLGSGGCPNATATRVVTVTAPVSAGTLSGTQNICIGDSVTFASTVLGGTWTSSNPAVATINSSTGAIVGVAAGSSTMTYTVLGSGGCPNATDVRTVTVTAPVVAGTLSGTQNICIGDPVTFASTVLGGSWTSSNPAVATINSSTGAIVGVAAGTSTMTYTVLGSGGCPNATDVRTVTVNSILSPVINCGTSTTSSVLFTWAAVSGATGYNLSYQINAGAVVNMGSIGNVTSYPFNSLSPGDTVSITLTPTGPAPSCFTSSSLTCTANNCVLPTASINYAGSPFCTTLSTAQSVTLTGTGSFSGGTFSAPAGLSINAASGDINPSASTPGPYTVTYTITGVGGCPNVVATTGVTITAPVSAGTLSGTQNICIGDSITFASTVLGGTWTSSNPAVATINAATGAIVGVTAGSSTMTYTVLGSGGCPNATDVRTVTVTAPVSAGTLSGTQNICIGDSVTFSSTVLGGTWVSSNTAVATINSSTGAIVGVAAGSSTMTYTVLGSGGCPNATATRTVTVTAPVVAGTLSGTQNICIGDSVTFASTVLGGTWTSSNPAVATINSSTGAIVGVAAGSSTMTYTVLGSGGCPNATATRTVTVTAPVVAGTLSGTQNICIGDSVTFASTVLGGTWSSSNLAVATINSSTGAIVGVTAGSSTMTYTVLGSGGCPNATDVRTVTVTGPVSAGTLSGTQNICIGDSVTFSSTVLGGTWTSSSPAVATINSSTGAIVGVSAGSSTMTYTVLGSGGCPNASDVRTVNVSSILSPVINCGTSTTSSVLFTWAAVSGATGYNLSYQINSGAVVNVGSIGNVTSYPFNSLSPGDTVSITLTPTGSAPSCFTSSSLTCTANNCVLPTASINYAGSPFCTTLSTAQSVTLTGTGSFSGGTFSAPAGLSINAASGDINPSASTPGPYTVTYTILGIGGCPNVVVTTNVTITAPVSAGTLSGTQNICIGDSVTFASTVLGGTWTSSNPAVATINSLTGAIVGVAAGTATMTYTVLGSGGCPNASDVRTVTVTAPVSAGTLSGTQNICIGDSVTFASTVLGGSWTSSNPAVATINAATGAIVGVTAGSSTMTYTVLGSGGCPNASDVRTLTVTAPVVAGTLSGTQNICIGDSVTFSSTVSGGTWTSSNLAVATINSSTGAIVGVSAGTSTMTYTVLGSGGCPNASDVRTVTVTAPVSAGTLSGTQNICIGDSVTFSSTVLGGSWTSSNPAVATINSSTGAIVGVATGSSTMTYTVLGSGGCPNATDVRTVTVTAPVSAGTLSGTQNICIGDSVTFASTVLGGSWVSSNPAVATINSSTGAIVGVSAGTSTMTYTVLGSGGCPNATATRTVTVTAPVVAGTLSGTQNICIGDSVTFASTVLGGTWTSSNPAVATINAATGAIVGVAAGSSTMTYTVLGSGGCPNATATRTVTVTAPVVAGTLSGTQNICIGDSVTFASTVLGGTWTSSNPAVATINAATGAIVGVAAGTTTMTYTVLGSGGCPNATATRVVTVTAPVSAGTLSGTQNICIGDSVTFASTVLGGTWTSSNPAVATINSSTGAIVGISAGSSTMTYTILGSGGCPNATATRIVTVTAPVSAGTLSGTQNICIGDSVTFASTVLGGTWTSSNTAVATINPATGVIVGIAAGSSTMTYTVLGSGGCPNATATRTVTITAPVVAGTLSGTQNICIGDSVTFASTVLGGTWTSSNPAVATINPSTGAIVGVAAGSSTMTYTVLGSGGCPNATATRTVTVTAPVVAGTLSGTQNICIGDSVTFASTVLGGTWTSSNPAVATINSSTGAIVGVAAGTSTMTYTVLGSGGCPNATATRTVTVTAPVVAGTLSGTQNICIGDSVTFASTVLGGSWTSSNPSVATINSSTGAIVGVAAGTTTMTYIVLGSGGCPNASDVRTVNVSSILSPVINCGTSTTSSVLFTWAAVSGATGYNLSYQINSGAVVNVGSIGNVTSYPFNSLSPGDTVSITLTPTGSAPSCFTSSSLTCTANNCVLPTASINYAGSPFCTTLSTAQSVTLTGTGSFSGGTFSAPAGLSINAASGDINPSTSTPGPYTVTYTITGVGGCPNVVATTNVTITAPVSAGTLSGTQNICIGDSVTFASTVLGGTWTSSNPAVATINSSTGAIVGVAAGTSTMTYTILGSGGCPNATATRVVTVTAPVSAGTLSGTQNICIGDSVIFASTVLGGTWTSSNPAVATINAATGAIVGVAAGTTTMTYTVPGSGGCPNATATRTVTVTAPVSAGTLSGTQNICIGDSVTFASTVLGGTWTSSNPAVATINSSTGAIVGVAAGSSTMTYTVLGSGGCPNATATRTVTVTAPVSAGTLSGTQNICIGDSVTFTSTVSGGTWTSSNPAIATINAATGAIVGIAAGSSTMTYTILGSGGCPNATATRTVTVTAPVVAGTLSGTQNICIGDPVTFASTVLGGSWTSSNPAVATINSSTGAIVGISAGSSTMTYTVLGSGGCPNATATRIVTVKPSPHVLNQSTYNICTGDNININLMADLPGTTFTWLASQNHVTGAGNGSGNTIATTLNLTGNSAGSVVYGVIPMANGCEGNPYYITVRVWPQPRPQLNDGFICLNILTNNAVQTHLLQTGLDNVNYTFDWYFNGAQISGANSHTYEADQAGTYSVIATNIQTGCVSDEVFASVTSSYVANHFVAEPSDAFSDTPYIIVHTPAGTGPFLYQLDFGPFQNSNIFYNVSSGLHTIRVKDDMGCTDLLGQVWILNYPKFFTPNDDTYNDTWNIPDLANQPDAHIYIFDRYAKFIKEISPQGEGWDGNHNGYPLPSTDYWFSVDYTDPNTFVRRNFKAHFSLKR